MEEEREHRSPRERMAEAAAHLLIAEGPAAITHRRVATAAGLAAGSGNYYFPSKRELYTAAVSGAENLRSEAARRKASDLRRVRRTRHEVAVELTEIFFAPGVGPDLARLRVLPMLDAGQDVALTRIMAEHRPRLARAVTEGLERMTGTRLPANDVELLMQVITTTALQRENTSQPPESDPGSDALNRLLELLGIPEVVGPAQNNAAP